MRSLFLAFLPMVLVACGDPAAVTESEARSEVRVSFVSDGTLSVETLQLVLAGGSWTRTLHGAAFERHPDNASTFHSGFVPIPGIGILTARVVIVQAGDTLAAADLAFPTEALYSYRLSFYPTRDVSGYGGDVAIPLAHAPSGSVTDSLFYRWSGFPIHPFE